MNAEMNKMRAIRIEKVVVNMGIGNNEEELKKGKEILEQIAKNKAVFTKAKIKEPKWNIRVGIPIGIKTTLRKGKADEFLKKIFVAKDNKISKKNFDNLGNFGLGIREHIELPATRYDPRLGIKGFDVLICLERAGYRVKRRRKSSKIGKKHLITKDEAIDFMRNKYGITIE